MLKGLADKFSPAPKISIKSGIRVGRVKIDQ
jgi:hypothetical protein